MKSKICHCCDTDESGNWETEPCCDNGICEAHTVDINETISNCLHCGGEMFKENNSWWHHSQEDIPIDDRGTMHYGI